jgi:hypothetical protein
MITQQFLEAPDVIGKPTGQGRSQQHFARFSLSLGCSPTQFMLPRTSFHQLLGFYLLSNGASCNEFHKGLSAL